MYSFYGQVWLKKILRELCNLHVLYMYVDELMYWVSIENPAVKMSSLNGTDQVTLLSESKAAYTGITLYNNSLYISDKSRRSVFYIILGFLSC